MSARLQAGLYPGMQLLNRADGRGLIHRNGLAAGETGIQGGGVGHLVLQGAAAQLLGVRDA